MEQRIIYTENDTVRVEVPAPSFAGSLDDLAKVVVPKGVSYRVVDINKLPASRNYRNAWTDANPTETVDVDLEKAKECQKALMVRKAHERIEPDLMGNKDFSVVQAEIEAIDFDAITDLNTLYNTFPASIDKRSGNREYIMHGGA